MRQTHNMRRILSRRTLHHRSQPHTLLQFVMELESNFFLTFWTLAVFLIYFGYLSFLAYISVYMGIVVDSSMPEIMDSKKSSLLEGILLSIDTRRFFKVV